MFPRPLAFSHPKNVLKTLVTAGLTLLGWAAGSAVVARPVGACSCAEPTWTVRLKSAHVDPAGDDQAQHWPLQGSLTSYPGVALIWADEHVAGVVGRAEADQ
jgi:hypothetical protein